MKGTIELVAGTGLDKNDIAEIRNAIEAALQGTRYEEVFSVTTTREIESDTSIYYLRVSAPFGGTTDNYAGMEHRLQSSLLCHVEFAQSPPSSTACLPRTALPSHEQPRPAASTHGQGRTAGNGPDHPRTPTNTINDF
jgi:hypothetical protein